MLNFWFEPKKTLHIRRVLIEKHCLLDSYMTIAKNIIFIGDKLLES